MAAILKSVLGNTQQKRSFSLTGNVLLHQVSFSTPVLFISQLNELVTSHLTFVPEANPVSRGFC